MLIGTLGTGGVIDDLAASGKLDVSAIRGKWEAYTLAMVANPTPKVRSALVIAGSDRRGTAYGVMTLSQAIGVSPWCWWADVPPVKRPALYVSVPASFHDAPAVRYRGIFINDEDWGLNPWARETFDPAFKNMIGGLVGGFIVCGVGITTRDGPDRIACWFIDTDYNGESFFVRHACFLGANDPYKALKTTLKAETNEEAWATLHSDVSRPFPKPESGRVAVKVINHLGDEVIKVFSVR